MGKRNYKRGELWIRIVAFKNNNGRPLIDEV